MKVSRNFQPESYLELISDYAYIVLDDELSSQVRKQTKIHLFEAYIPRIYADAIPLMLKEARSSPLRSLILISAVSEVDTSLYAQFDYKVFSDDEIVKLLSGIDAIQQSIKQYIEGVFGPQAEVYQHRLKLREVQLAVQFYDLFQSSTLQQGQLPDDSVPELLAPVADQLRQYNEVEASCIKNTFYSNQEEALKSQLQVLESQEFNYQASASLIEVQDFEQLFTPKALESLECKQTLFNHCMHFITHECRCYNPIEQQFPLCDDPTKPWFYINDARINYNTPVDNLPYGRLLIQGNYLKQPSCILQGVALSEGAEELSEEYESFETSIAKACHAVSQLLVSATKHSRRVLTLIEDEIKQIQALDAANLQINYQSGDFSLKEEDVYRNTLDVDVDNFIVENSVLLNEIGYDRRRLPFYERFEQISSTLDADLDSKDLFIKRVCERLVFPINAVKSRDWVMDYDEMFTVSRNYVGQSPVSLYTQEPTIKPTAADDVIVIRPKYVQTQYQLTIGRNARPRTTYQLIVLIAQFLSLISQVDPLPKRPYMHRLIFNERLALKSLFVPHEVVEECEQERLHLQQQEQGRNDVKNAIMGANGKQYYDLVVQRLQEISSRDKFAKAKVVEDYNPGDCAVCNMRFDSYKNHIYTQDHMRNYRNLMQQNENMIMELQKFQVKYEVIQACNAQLHSVACTLAAELNCSYAQAVYAINDSLRAIGGQYELDPEDAPRASSPSCKSNNFVHWREDQNLKRESLLESILTTAESRKSGYKRIKSCAGTFVASVLCLERNRRRCVEEYLKRAFAVRSEDNQNALNLNLLDYMYYEYIDEDDHFEKGLVRISLRPEPQYLYHSAGYDQLLNIAYTTLLCRAMQGQQLSAESPQHMVFEIVESPLSSDAHHAEIVSYLSDCFPQINGSVYENKLESMEQLRLRDQNIMKEKQQRPSVFDVVRIDIKTLKQELADVEIGHIPRTDCIIGISRAIIQTQRENKLTIMQMYQLAIEEFKKGAVHGIQERVRAQLQHFIETNEIQELEVPADDETSCEVVPQPQRMKLPRLSVFDPLVQQNRRLAEEVAAAAEAESNSGDKQTEEKDSDVFMQGRGTAVAQEGALELGAIERLIGVEQGLIQRIFSKAADILGLPLVSLVLHDSEIVEAAQTVETVEPGQTGEAEMTEQRQNNISGANSTGAVSQESIDDQKFGTTLDSQSHCFYDASLRSVSSRAAREAAFRGPLTDSAVRSNSVCSRGIITDAASVSLRLLDSSTPPAPPTQALASVSNAELLTVGAPTSNRFFERIAERYVTQPPPSTVYRLTKGGVSLTAAPLLSTSLEHSYYTNMLSDNFLALSRDQQFEELHQFIPLSRAQTAAVYATLATVFGGFGNIIEISVQFWKSAADALLGSSASICSYQYEEDSYGLNIADIASTTLVALAARARLLEAKADASAGIEERPVRAASRQVERCIPPEGLADRLVVQQAVDAPEECDVKVIENGRFERGLDCDICLGGIYALNGYECD